MEAKTNIKVKGGKWTINGKSLTEYKGDRWAIESLLMSAFKIKRIQSSVGSAHFRPAPQPKHWTSFTDVIATVNRPHLKIHNYQFKTLRKDKKDIKSTITEPYPNIASVSFVRAMGEE